MFVVSRQREHCLRRIINNPQRKPFTVQNSGHVPRPIIHEQWKRLVLKAVKRLESNRDFPEHFPKANPKLYRSELHHLDDAGLLFTSNADSPSFESPKRRHRRPKTTPDSNRGAKPDPRWVSQSVVQQNNRSPQNRTDEQNYRQQTEARSVFQPRTAANTLSPTRAAPPDHVIQRLRIVRPGDAHRTPTPQQTLPLFLSFFLSFLLSFFLSFECLSFFVFPIYRMHFDIGIC